MACPDHSIIHTIAHELLKRCSSGELGDGTTVDRTTPVQVSSLSGVSAVSAERNHSLFLKSDGTVWATGANTDGQLGDGTTVNKSTPVQVLNLSGVSAVSAGYLHSLFLKSDGTVWATGANFFGQLGDGTITDEVLCFGSNRFNADSSGDGVSDGILVGVGLTPFTDVSAILSLGEAAGITQGVDSVLADPGSHSLYYLSEIADLRPGSAMIEIIGGDAIINMKVEESIDLINWFDTGETSSVTLPAPSPGKKFFRFGD